MKVTGWIGFLAESSQINRGIDIFAHEKAAELASFFNLATTHAQYARAHLVGEIHANFIDEKNDQISDVLDQLREDSRVFFLRRPLPNQTYRRAYCARRR